ncbi:hypothetical protein NECAME_11873 [Necator americanus]|uniref:Uncharacterized protein n=1 Tax=Necator americanus TaxID=51031 RepID=W2T4N1_NECAM|nr:hypothetical protein NECAME_11873 [Necator americanus]ETN76186.1 hypothetical protein NECAME_11873 [Necator americanus]
MWFNAGFDNHAYAPTSSYEEEKVGAFCMDLEKGSRNQTIPFFEKDLFFTQRGEKAAKFTQRTSRIIIEWQFFASFVGFWEYTVMDNINDQYVVDQYVRLVKHLHDCTRKAKSFKITKDACLWKP